MPRSAMFLKVTGQRTGEVVGESSDKRFRNQIDIVDWSWGMSSPSAAGTGQAARRAVLHELKIVKRADKASTALMNVMNNNELLTSVVLSVCKPGGAAQLPYMIVTLGQGRITGFEIQSDLSSEGAPTLTEHVSLSFRSITVDYTMQSETGAGLGASSFEAEVFVN